MSAETVFKGFFVAIFSLIIAWQVFFRYDAEIGTERDENEQQRYAPFISGCLLPILLLMLVAIAFMDDGIQGAAEMLLSMCFSIFLHISLYYVLLMLLLPFLRKHINARVCALLWMIPNYLYITQQEFMQVSRPLFVIRAPGKIVWALFYIWLIGFVAVLAWHTVTHLIFRSRILKNATPVTDSAIIELWNAELERANIRSKKLMLLISSEVTTPLSIGLLRFSTRMVLPKKDYTLEDLTLILRHEIIHIGREDAWSKFFLVFCTAMCWFNPLMWIAMRKSADDLELSCDETVLLNADEDTRRQYANLILNTVGNERGFTTCLSASATALRYRLKNIMKPQARPTGALIVALVFFLLFMSCGYVALAYDSSTGSECIYQSRNTELYTLKHITTDGESGTTTYKCTDTTALQEYLAGLTLDTITGNYSFPDNEKQLIFIYETPEGTLGIVLSDSFIKLAPLYERNSETIYYYLSEGVDWEYLDSLISEE